MTDADKLQATILANTANLPEYLKRIGPINERIRGWSNVNHYLFFKSFIDAFPEAKSILIVGVYLGRDIAYMLDAAGERPLNITGVDKFNAEPCDDWPQEKRGMTWEEAFNCPPPDIEAAAKNIGLESGSIGISTDPLGFYEVNGRKGNHSIRLIKADDKDWLESATGVWDLHFWDASHDGPTVQRQLRGGHKLCHPHTIISGDDYQNVQPGWGVTEAVTQAFKSHFHLDYRIWFAGAEDYL